MSKTDVKQTHKSSILQRIIDGEDVAPKSEKSFVDKVEEARKQNLRHGSDKRSILTRLIEPDPIAERREKE